MNTILSKIAAVLAAVIGAMAIFAGGQVLLGNVPDYYVISWLPIVNFAIGLVSLFFTAMMIWRNSSVSLPLALITLGAHAAVMLVLQTVYRDVVASDSLKATTVRISVWVVILVLLFLQKRKNTA